MAFDVDAAPQRASRNESARRLPAPAGAAVLATISTGRSRPPPARMGVLVHRISQQKVEHPRADCRPASSICIARKQRVVEVPYVRMPGLALAVETGQPGQRTRTQSGIFPLHELVAEAG